MSKDLIESALLPSASKFLVLYAVLAALLLLATFRLFSSAIDAFFLALISKSRLHYDISSHSSYLKSALCWFFNIWSARSKCWHGGFKVHLGHLSCRVSSALKSLANFLLFMCLSSCILRSISLKSKCVIESIASRGATSGVNSEYRTPFTVIQRPERCTGRSLAFSWRGFTVFCIDNLLFFVFKIIYYKKVLDKWLNIN